MTSLELRDQFGQCGYDIGNAGVPATSQYVAIRDRNATVLTDPNTRIVMAIIYADAAAARAAHQRAHSKAEERIGQRWAFSDDQGPQLLAGYGGSVWRANVALVQSSGATLASMWSVDAQTDEARIARPELLELGFATNLNQYAVDRDFVACLEDGSLTAATAATAATVTPASAMPVTPTFLPGHPW
jgi:hypothetical protein